MIGRKEEGVKAFFMNILHVNIIILAALQPFPYRSYISLSSEFWSSNRNGDGKILHDEPKEEKETRFFEKLF